MKLKHSKPGTLIPGSRPFVIAHRGAAREAPENTIEAFARAVLNAEHFIELEVPSSRNLRPVIIELDAQSSLDKELVVIHDKKVDRTTDGKGEVAKLTLAELKRLDAGYRFTTDNGATYPYRGKGVTISTLDEVFTRFPNVIFLVELKDSSRAAVDRLAELLAKHDAYDRVIVVTISAKHRAAARLRKLSPRIHTGHSSREIAMFVALSRTRLTRLFSPTGLTFEVPLRKYRLTLPTKAFIRQAHKKGISILVWTVNDPGVMRQCIDLGVDGIITDDTPALVRVMRESTKH